MSWKAFKNELAILDPEKDTFGVPQDSDEGAVDWAVHPTYHNVMWFHWKPDLRGVSYIFF